MAGWAIRGEMGEVDGVAVSVGGGLQVQGF